MYKDKYSIPTDFANLEIGDKFKWAGNKYMKIREITLKYNEVRINAVNLDEGESATFYQTSLVYIKGRSHE